MAYFYKTILFKNASNVIGFSSSDITQNNTDKTDFEINFKATAVKVNDVIIAETTFISDLSYTNFKVKIVSPLTWGNVRYTEDATQYILNLLSDIAL